MANDINVKVGMSGESSFRQSLKNIDNELRTVGTEVKKVSSEFIGNENSIDALTAKNEVLTRQYETQKSKVELLGKQLDEAKQKYGEGSDQVQRLQQKLNIAETAMNKTDAEIKKNAKSMEELGDESKKTGDNLEDAGENGLKFGDILKANVLSNAITGGIKALGNAVKSIASGMVNAVKESAEWADELNTLAKQTGLSTAQLQKYQFASEQIDVSVDTIAGSMAKMTRNMATATKGTGDAYKAFTALGVSITDSNGQLRDNEEVFQEVIAALGEVGNETQADAYAMQIFGKSAQDLNPLIRGGADALKELSEQAERNGLILGQDELDSLNTVTDAFDTFKASMSQAGKIAVSGFAEPLAAAMNTVTEYVGKLVSAFREDGISGLFSELGNVVSDLAAKITAALPSITTAAIGILKTILSGIQDNLPIILDSAIEIINSLVSGLIELLPELVGVALQLVISLAQGIGEALPELVPALVSVIMEIVDVLTDPGTLVALLDAAIAIIIGLTEGIVDAIPKLVERMPEIIINIVSALIQAVPRLLAVGPKMMESLATGMINNTASVIRAVKDLWNRIVEAFSSLVSGAKEWGKDMIENFVAGIKGMIDKVKNAVKNVASAVKDFLGFSEPKRGPLSNFHTYAPDMMKLFAQGIRDNEYRVTDQLAASFSGLKFPVEAQYGTMGSALQNIASGMVGDFVSNITLEIDGTTLARKQYRYNLAEVARNGGALA